MYHIFKVTDYKGGELISKINLTKKEIARYIAEMVERWHDPDEEEDNVEGYECPDDCSDCKREECIACLNYYEKISTEKLFSIIESIYDNNSDTYAGRGGICEEMYQTDYDGRLVDIRKDDYNEIIKIAHEILKNE